MKFAFIANVAGATPETYSAVFESPGSYNLIAGVDGMDAAKEYIKKLAGEGFEMFNLCGDFDDEITAEIREMVGPEIEVSHADYSAAQMAKLEKLESFKEYGIIILDDDIEDPHHMAINNEECNAHIIFVKDLEQAEKAGKTLIEEKVDFIELCSWFDNDKMEAVVKATEDSVPVGTCAELK